MSPATLAEIELQAGYPRGIAARVDSTDLARLLVEHREMRAALTYLLQEVLADTQAIACIDLRIITRAQDALAQAGAP